MDRLKESAKGAKASVSKAREGGGLHLPGDRAIHRDSWKSDLKGMAPGGKRKDPYEEQRNHQSAPLSSLKDPDSFGPPPKHTAVHGSNAASPASPARQQQPGGWGSSVPAPSRRQQQEDEERQRLDAEKAKAPPVPYRTDTTGLTTANLPKPPVRRVDGPPPAPPPRHNSPASSTLPPVPPRQQQQRQVPTPTLPPRMNENPDEYTPPPPPSYNEAVQHNHQDPAAINQNAAGRLSQAGISVPGFGIGNEGGATPPLSPAAGQGHAGQLSELQQRFARMNAGGTSQPSPPPTPTSTSTPGFAAAAYKKPPPPPPPKKFGFSSPSGSRPSTGDAANAPPPLPLSSKPRPI